MEGKCVPYETEYRELLPLYEEIHAWAKSGWYLLGLTKTFVMLGRGEAAGAVISYKTSNDILTIEGIPDAE